MVKYDSSGKQLWNKSFGDSSNDVFKSIIETKNGEIIVAGYSNFTNAGFDNKGNYDAIIVSYDSTGVEDVEMLGAVNLTINSSLTYQLNAYMPVEIANSDKFVTLPIDTLNIKESSEIDYKQFANTADKVVLKDGCVRGNDKVHTIDFKLASNQAHKAYVYKTVVRFKAEQK